MRRFLPALIAVWLLVSCTDASTTGASPSPTAATTSSISSPSPIPELPAGVPPYFESDVPSEDVPPLALVPLTAEVTGSWSVFTATGEAIIVAWQFPGTDPFRLNRGLAAWRRFDDEGAPWRPVWGAAFPKREGVLGIDATTGDMSGDGSDDVLVFAGLGGSGGCGTYMVLDPSIGQVLFEREVCDAVIDPSASPIGLLIREAVYEPDDPHCCPSAMRERVLTYSDGDWREVSATLVPAP